MTGQMSGNEGEERRQFDGCARCSKRSIDPLRPRASKHGISIFCVGRGGSKSQCRHSANALRPIFCWFVYLRSVVSPRAEFHVARLLVEREVLDVDLAEGFVNSRRFPLDGAVVAQDGFGHDGHFVITVGAASGNKVIVIITANCWRPDPAIDARHLLTVRCHGTSNRRLIGLLFQFWATFLGLRRSTSPAERILVTM